MNIKNINFRLTDEEYNVLKSMCERNKQSIGTQIREIVKDAIYYEIASKPQKQKRDKYGRILNMS